MLIVGTAQGLEENSGLVTHRLQVKKIASPGNAVSQVITESDGEVAGQSEGTESDALILLKLSFSKNLF